MSGWVRGPRLEEVAPGHDAAVAAARAKVVGPPVLVQLGLALGLLVSGGFLCGGLLAVLDELVQLPRDLLPAVAGLTGVAMLLGSAATSWLALPWVARPLVLVGAVVGRGLVAVAASDVLHDDPRPVMIAVEALLLLVHRDPLQRFGAVVMLVGWIVGDEWARAQWVLPPVLGAGLALASTRRLWLGGPAAPLLAPSCGALLAVSLVLPSLGEDPWSPVIPVALASAASVLASVVASGVGLSVVDRLFVALFPLAVGAVSWGVPGLTVALLVATAGFLARSPVVWISAVAALVGYAAWFYYDLDLPLAQKGGVMIAVGATCVAAAWRAGARGDQARPPADRAGWAWAALGGVAAIGGIWAQAGWQEVRLAGAPVVYLDLAPRDPRSLVQGDYQRLGYRLTGDLERLGAAGSGWAVLEVDEDRVAHLVRLDDGRPTGPSEVRVRYASEDGAPSVASRAWLFEEGTGEAYAPARYGVVAIPPDGRAVLVGLADAERHRLGAERRLW